MTSPPGNYRGTLLADGHPDIWLPVVLVRAAAKLMTSTADHAELIVTVEGRLREVGKVGAPLDAGRDA